MSNPFSSLIAWVKANKLSAFLLTIVVFGLFNLNQSTRTVSRQTTNGYMGEARSEVMMDSLAAPMAAKSIRLPFTGGGDGAPDVPAADRLVSRTTSLSIKVKDVSESLRQIEALAVQLGGFMVNTSNSSVDEGADGSISIRVPSEKRADALAELRQTGVRVVSESVQGTDITDQYQDITEQLRILNLTKTKFESLLNKAEKISDMLEVQRELTNLQSQIDMYKGQQDYLASSAKYTLITAYLSTDELALPYTSPGQAWRPGVVFKEAIRSLMIDARGLGNGLIWLGVYTPLWLPVLLGYLWWVKRQKTRAGV